MKSKSHVLVVGDCGFAAMTAVESAAVRAGVGVAYVKTRQGAAEHIAEAPPIVVAISLDAPDNAFMAADLRARTALHALPLVGLSDNVGDLVFAEALAAGFDDVCATDGRALARRIRQLGGAVPTPVAPRGDTVVVADPDAAARRIIGRAFRNAGYRVLFADDAERVRALAGADVRVAVIAARIFEQDPGGLSALAAAVAERAVFIVNTPPREMAKVQATLEGSPIVVHDAFAAPDTLLFVANERLNRPIVEARASQRLLYGTVVRFRTAGHDDTDLGYLYNLSAGGLYVRTLAPPARGEELWLEFVPPRSDRSVHIEGAAVWTRAFGGGVAATVPCGFGVQISGGSERDLARYARSYRTFRAEREGRTRRGAVNPERLGFASRL